MSLHVVVPGVPQGQGAITSYGRGMTVHSNAKVLLPWRQKVSALTRQAMFRPQDGYDWPMRGPVAVSLRFYLPRPKSAPKSRTRPDRRPDIDHLVRACFDALVDAHAIEDDGRVVELHAFEFYAVAGHRVHMDVPGCVIGLSAVTEDGAA